MLNPQVERLLHDPLFLAVVNHDSSNGDVGFLALDGLFVSVSIVVKQEVGSSGSASSGNQIIHHFVVKFGPFDMCLLIDTVDLVHQENIIFLMALVLVLCIFPRSCLSRGKSSGCSQF